MTMPDESGDAIPDLTLTDNDRDAVKFRQGYARATLVVNTIHHGHSDQTRVVLLRPQMVELRDYLNANLAQIERDEATDV